MSDIFKGYPSAMMLRVQTIALYVASAKIQEATGHNDHPLITFALGLVKRHPGEAYCAAFASMLVMFASMMEGREKPPLVMSGLVADIRRDAMASGVYFRKQLITDARMLVPGLLVDWDYGMNKGHIGVVIIDEAHPASGKEFWTVEGNRSNRIMLAKRTLNDANLSGFTVFP